MRLIVGLGNPGREYDDTRHNIGFLVLDALADRAGVSVRDKKFKALVGRGRLARTDCLLMKPQTYMNLSGESVGPALGFFKVATADLIVIHDDLDLEAGRIKLKRGGGHGGHNGLRSLKACLPDDGFIRVRVGIGRPPPRWDPSDYVLGRFSDDEWPTAEKAVEDAARATESILELGIAKAMGRINGSAKKEKRAKAQDDAPNGGHDDQEAARRAEEETR